MSYFQNPFSADYEGPWNLGDRQYCVTFKCPRNAGRGDDMVTVWTKGPYNLSGNDAAGNARNTLNLWFAIDPAFKNWAKISVNIATGAVSSSAVTPAEIMANLVANNTFSSFFTVDVNNKFDDESPRLSIKCKLPVTRIKFYVENGRAEEALGFNARAGVAELPTYFARHTIANRFTYTDSVGMLVQLDPSNAVDANVIDNAVDFKGVDLNFDHTVVQGDWKLLGGRSGLFLFRKSTIDGSSRPTVTIEYHAGAKVGDLAKRITYTYTGGATEPTNYTEEPYTLTSGDLITPA